VANLFASSSETVALFAMLASVAEFYSVSIVRIIPTSSIGPRPEEHAPEVGPARLRHVKKDRNRQQPISIARVSKDGHRRDRAGGHPSSFESLRTAAHRNRLLPISTL